MRALRISSLTLLLALDGSSAAFLQRGQQKRRRELRGTRLLGAVSGGVASLRFSSQASELYTIPQQAALASVAALAGICFTEVVATALPKHGVAQALRRVGLWVAQVRKTPRKRPPRADPIAGTNIDVGNLSRAARILAAGAA